AVIMPSADDVADFYDLATAEIEAAGLHQYEISNWARPGFESRHNSVYWTDGDYLGIGAGAHGYIAGERFENIAHPRAYIAATREKMPAGGAVPATVAHRYRPDPPTAITDWIGLRLRLLYGFTRGEFHATFGLALDTVAGPPL